MLIPTPIMPLMPVRTVAPALSPVTVAEAKITLRVEHEDDDGLIETLIGVATGYLDGYAGILGRCLISQTWRADFSAFPGCQWIKLPLLPASSVTHVKYIDGDGSLQTLTSGWYSLVTTAHGAHVYLDDDYSWPTTNETPSAVQVTAVYGYGSAASDVPASLRYAIHLHVAHLYDGRAGKIDDMPAYSALVAPYKTRRLG